MIIYLLRDNNSDMATTEPATKINISVSVNSENGGGGGGGASPVIVIVVQTIVSILKKYESGGGTSPHLVFILKAIL